MGIPLLILFMGYGFFQIYAAYQAAFYHFGDGLLIWIGMGFLLFFRFFFIITILSFLCATDIWGWEWYWAGLFAAPGLVFQIPAFLLLMTGFIISIFQKND
jgi:hypothetical protein